MDMINLNTLAVDVAEEEGKKVELNIGQIKEVISITLKKLAQYDDEQILEVVKRFKNLEKMK